jgi:KaiC/GvpD/RAD55 family RecA-like ATPase
MKKNNTLEHIIQTNQQGTIIMIELPTNTYFEINSSNIKLLINNGFQGIYISFQRPFNNIISHFKENGIETNNIQFIDAATLLSGEEIKEDNTCTYVSPNLDIDELVKSIYTLLVKLKGSKKFIFIDSLTTLSLYKPLSETMRFSEFLIRTIRRTNKENIMLIFNVAKDLAQKKFIRDVAFNVDQVIGVEDYE